MEKYKFIILIFVLGMIFDTIGAFFKIMHLQIGFLSGNFLLFLGMLFKVGAAVFFIVKLFTKDKSFENK